MAESEPPGAKHELTPDEKRDPGGWSHPRNQRVPVDPDHQCANCLRWLTPEILGGLTHAETPLDDGRFE